MSTLLSRSQPTARKQHRCEQCSRIIEAGERYERQNSVSDNGFDTWRSCLQCLALAQDLWDEDCRDEDENGGDCLARLWDVEWPDVRKWSPLWAQRSDLFAQQWAGHAYPTGVTP